MNNSIQTSSTSTLRARILQASAWTFGGHVTTQMLRLASNLVMTRLLVPKMFGVMALANVFLTGLTLLSDLGLTQNIVQNRRGGDESYLNTSWTVQIIRGALIWALALAASGALELADRLHMLAPGTTYAEPLLPGLLAAISFNGLIAGFNSTKLATASRALSLGRLVKIDIYSQVAALLIMIAWALFSPTAWALVGGAVVSALTMLTLSHTYLPGPRNRLHWDPRAFREIFSFGKWIFVTSILGYLVLNGDRILLAGLIGPTQFGLYIIAVFMIAAIAQIFSKLINGVAFPALSEVARNRPSDLRSTYYKFRIPLDTICLFTSGLLFGAGDLIIRVLYSQRYQPAGHMLQILAISLIAVRYNLVSACMLAVGKPRLLAPVQIAQLIVLLAGTPLAFHRYGLNGALAAIVASSLTAIPVFIFIKHKLAILDFRRELLFLPCLPAGYFFGLAIGSMPIFRH